MLVRDQVNAVPSGHDRNAQFFNQFKEILISARDPYAISGIDHRTFGSFYLVQDRIDQLVRRLLWLLCLTLLRIKRAKIIRIHERTLYIQRDIEPARTGTPNLREIQRLFQTIPDIKRIDDHLAVLRHAVHRLADIKLLISHRTQSESGTPSRRIVADLTGKDEHRNRIQPSADDARNRIRSARPRRHAHSADPVVHTSVRLASDRTCLLMMLINTVKPLLMPQSVIEVHRASTRHSKHRIDSVLHQKLRHII